MTPPAAEHLEAESAGSSSGGLSSLRKALTSVAEVLERHHFALPVCLMVLFAFEAWTGSLHKQLWHDELFTYLIAQAPDWHMLLHWTRTLDLNPPLSFALARLSLDIFGTSPEAGRLPFLIGILACGGLLYRSLFLWTRSTLWSALGLALVLEEYRPFAIEMRPYALEAGLLALAVLAWQNATGLFAPGYDRADKPPRTTWLILLSVSVAAGLLSHLFFVLVWAAFLFAESVRAFTRRKLDIPVAVALLAVLPCLAIYKPIFAMHAASYFPLKLQPKLLVAPWFYVENGIRILWLLLPGILACLLLWRFNSASARSAGTDGFSARPWLALLLALGAVPGLLILYLHVTHGAFFWRYGFVLGYVYALLFPLLAFRLFQGRRSAGLLLFAGVFLFFSNLPILAWTVRHPEVAFTRPPTPICIACRLAETEYLDEPLVIANGLSFVELNERESAARLQRMVYLMDRDAAIQYAHATIFEGIPAEHDAWHFTAPVESYGAFVAAHRSFVVYGTKDSPEQWLLRKLEADGARETLIDRVNPSGYGDAELWRIVMPISSPASPPR